MMLSHSAQNTQTRCAQEDDDDETLHCTCGLNVHTFGSEYALVAVAAQTHLSLSRRKPVMLHRTA